LVFPLKELDLPLLKVTSTELISGVSGESEENIRAIFEKAIVCIYSNFILDVLNAQFFIVMTEINQKNIFF
jgi:AAA+ superfamily predicted ATPase